MKISRLATICIASALASGGCATAGAPWRSSRVFAEAMTLCDLLANHKAYEGKRVLVRGYLIATPHGRQFFDEGCEDGFILLNLDRPWSETPGTRRLRQLFDAYSDEFLQRPPFVPVVYSGVLKDHRPAIIGFGPFSLEDAEMAALRRRDARKKDRKPSRYIL